MKRICFFAALLGLVQIGHAQLSSLLPLQGGLKYSQYLISPNGQYKFYNRVLPNQTVKREWALIKVATGEKLFETESFESNTATVPALDFKKALVFTAVSCGTGKLCQQIFASPENNIYKPVPLLVNVRSTGFGTSFNFLEKGFVGITGAYQRIWINAPPLADVPVPANDEVFVKNPTTGVYNVPVDKRAAALKLLDDGNMVIVNNANGILWESATGAQQILDTRVNKKFKDVTTSFAKGFGLMAQGNVELINANISQSAGNVVLIAHTYVQILPGAAKSSLVATAAGGSIELKCVGGTPPLARPGGDIVTPTANPPSETNTISAITVYPNPSKGIINFKTTVAGERIIYINIIDNSGRYYLQRYADTDKADLSGLAPGIYSYKVVTNITTYYGQCVKVAE